MSNIDRSSKRKNQGYTLLELMITVAIIAIIAAIAIPSYIDYTKRTYFSEVIRATAPYKIGVVQCYNTTGTLVGCSSMPGNSNNGIPPTMGPVPDPSVIGSISVTNGIITASAKGNTKGGLNNETYILIPQVTSNGVITWTVSGTGVAAGLTK